ncbi:hypothetical protein DFH08DRAFT_807169 [Mycena albidolilacea]|uniref:Alpha-type protein kinase domain-containing protein n=1 Tax=Mycena albidolilacea TaxID=1033008 RepID=A0AAD7A5A0_9AGAR|nr:hypothetical protein DFH08DRAFT_807169 [Mycena albidolilacea]
MNLAELYLYLEALILIPEVHPIFEETTGCKVPDFILLTKDQKSVRRSSSTKKATLRNMLEGLFKGQPYAFKRFKDVGLGKDTVQRLQLGWFYAEFERRAKLGNIQIEVLRVIECLLAFELTPQKVDPSVVSGYKDVDINITDVPMTWLMESFYTTKEPIFGLLHYAEFSHPGPQKWSGTNQHPSHPKSSVGSTANAFTHFVYATSFGTIAIANIQMLPARIGNTAADVMFDLTTHTTEGNSRVGDHGTSGLTTFRQEHECVSHCNKLNLGDLVDPDAEEPENDDL